MPRLRLLVARPAVRVPPVFLIGRQPVHAVPAQNAMHRGTRDRQAVKPLQVIGNLARAEVVVLPEVEDLADDLCRRRPRRAVRRPGPVRQSGITVLVIPPSPFVERLSGNPEMPAGARHVAGTSRPPGASSGASWLTAFALISSSGLHSKVFRLRKESWSVTSVLGFHTKKLVRSRETPACRRWALVLLLVPFKLRGPDGAIIRM